MPSLKKEKSEETKNIETIDIEMNPPESPDFSKSPMKATNMEKSKSFFVKPPSPKGTGSKIVPSSVRSPFNMTSNLDSEN
jgi:hypothetical protein